MKEEDAFVASVKEALIADGWRPPTGASVPQNSSAYKGSKNRLGDDGKPIRCFHCDSEYHLSFQCENKKQKQEDLLKKSVNFVLIPRDKLRSSLVRLRWIQKRPTPSGTLGLPFAKDLDERAITSFALMSC